MNTMIKNLKLAELNIKIATDFSNTHILRWFNRNVYKCLCCNKNYGKRFDENLKKEFFNTGKFFYMMSIGLFYCCEKVLTIMNIKSYNDESDEGCFLEDDVQYPENVYDL